MSANNFFGLIANTIVMALLLVGLAAPWFQFNVDQMSNVTKAAAGGGVVAGGTTTTSGTTSAPGAEAIVPCSVSLLYQWPNKGNCESGGCTSGEPIASVCAEETFGWKSNNLLCGNVVGSEVSALGVTAGNCNHSGKAFGISLGMLLFSFLVSFLLTFGFFLRCCCSKSASEDSGFMMIVAIIGLLFNIASIVFFMVHLPKGLELDGFCGVLEKLVGFDLKSPSSPCASMSGGWGGMWNLDLIPPSKTNLKWGPSLGWILSVVAIPMWLIVIGSAKPTKASGSGIQGGAAGDYKQYQ